MTDEEKRKNEMMSKLRTIHSSANLQPHERVWIMQVIDYIKEAK
jgi:hypothetical protein